MTREEIWTGLQEILDESAEGDVDWSAVTEATEIESFGFDSLVVLDLIFDLEQKFDVKIAPAQILEMRTLKDLVDFLDARTA